ncbi:MAG: DUF3488 and transglutaminase-like domain-containing protein [Verrucomicrobiota bacterium JB022]|nr:DUF3488 and transglutaminase-like domain-containing protein [Verrucomicrobiota bacterium JB022]
MANLQAKLEFRYLQQLKWLLGGLMALIAMAGVFSLGLGAELWVTLGMLAVGGVMLWPQLSRRVPAWAWKSVTPVLIIIIVTDFVLAAGDVLAPLVRMILFLTILRAVQERQRREDLQLLLLCLFLVIATGVLSMELSFALQVLLFTPVALFQLFTINLSENYVDEQEVDPDRWKHFRWVELLRYLRQVLHPRLLGLSTLLFFGLTGFASLIFISLPRFDLGQQLPFARLSTTAGLPGLSEEVEYGDVVDLLDDETIALRVDVGGDTPPSNPYWRMLVLDEFTGEGFRASRSLQATSRFRDLNSFSGEGPFRSEGDTGQTWTFYFEGGLSRYLPLPGPFGQLRLQSEMSVGYSYPARTIRLQEAQNNVLFYRLENLAPNSRYIPAFTRELNWFARLDPEPLEEEAPEADRLGYPATTLAGPQEAAARAALARWVAEIEKGEDLGPNTFITHATAFLQRDRGYSTSVTMPDEGWTDNRICRWIEAGLPGHCELYAGALILLAREAGIPARMVTGFAGGDWNPYEHYIMVRNRHAHAWVEFFDPELGWVRADPTPSRGLLGEQSQQQDQGRRESQIDDTLGAYIDSLRVMWYRRVVSFDQNQQQAMLEGLRDSFKKMGPSLRERLAEWWQGLRTWWAEGLSWGKLGHLALQILITLMAWLGLRMLWVAWAKHRAARPGGLEPARKRAGMWLRRLEGLPAGADPEASRAVCEQLLLIRYGDAEAWPRPQTVFRQARKLRTHLRSTRSRTT